jgi:acetylornithine deacetylase
VELRSAVEAGWEHQLELLVALVRSPSTLGRERDAQELIAAELADLGLSPQMWDVGALGPGSSPPLIEYTRRPNVTAMRRGTGGGRSLTFNGHIDVVPVGVERNWSYDPWGATVAGGRMYGRGAADMKAGLVAMLGALRALREVELRGTLCVETVIEEECTGNGAAACRARGPRTDAALIPEPFNHLALREQVGVLWATVTVTGKAAHAERAHEASNAVVNALPVIERIRELEREVNRDAPLRLNYNIGVVRAGDWASSVPEECVLEVRLAASPGEDLAAVRARFEAAVEAQVQWRGFQAQGFSLAATEPIFDVLARAHGSVHDEPLGFLSFTGTTDARAFVVHDQTPATCYGPIGGNLHAPDEWVDLDSVRDTTLVLAEFAAEWCG